MTPFTMEKLKYRPMESNEYDKHMGAYLEEYIADISKYEEEFIKIIGLNPRKFSKKQFKDKFARRNQH